MISEFHKSNVLSSKICTTAISVTGGSNGTFLHHFLASQNKANTSDNVFVRVFTTMLSFTIQWLTESLPTVQQITRITLMNCLLYLVFLDIRRWRLRTVLLRCHPCTANTSRLNATLNTTSTIRETRDDIIMGDSNISGNTYNSQNFEQPPSLNSFFESLKMKNILKLS